MPGLMFTCGPRARFRCAAGGRPGEGQGVDRRRWLEQGHPDFEEVHAQRQAQADHILPGGEKRHAKPDEQTLQVMYVIMSR